MILQHISAFCNGDFGGNPAGVVLRDVLPETVEMQALAREFGYSETVFAAPIEDRWKVRYFSPNVEVDFCGHATIALGAALTRRVGNGAFTLDLNHTQVTVDGHFSDEAWGASFRSPPTHSTPVPTEVLNDALALFSLDPDLLDPRIPPAIAHGGGDHLVLALKTRETLRHIKYEMKDGKALALREGLITFSLIYAEKSNFFHARNPFPLGGVYEDPATGAAAAALGAYLRDLGWPHGGSIVIHQGEDMGTPSRLHTEITSRRGEGIRVSGSTRFILPP